MPLPDQSPSADEPRIDLTSKSEVHYWTRFFDCTELELRSAFSVAGPFVADVWAYVLLLRRANLLT